VRGWRAERVAQAAGARLLAPGLDGAGGPSRAVIDSRAAGPGDLFAALPGERVDGGRFAPAALQAGVWGVLVADAHGPAAVQAAGDRGVVLAAGDPLAALQRLATAWRRELGCPVVGITGSVGKTSTKDVLRAMLAVAGRRVVANERNLNTEIGLPLTVLGAPPGTEVLVVEMGMRGPGQIAELVAIAEPTVGVITALGPVHLEQMGTMEAIAAEKASLVAGLPAAATAILPAGERLLDPHHRDDLATITFGPGGDVDEAALDAAVQLVSGGEAVRAAHLRRNACAALAAARAIGADPRGRVEVELSELRGQRLRLPGAITLVNDCYNANPVSMRAALDDLAATAPGRRVAVLGDMRELGPGERELHAQVGAYARERGVELLVAVGELSRAYGGDVEVATAAEAAEVVGGLLREGDTVLVKASRGVGLEVVAEALA
jgi:UDP-N-acetylmuramoyl-tripeptide--D-alanyl-D-alanine ligase